MLTVWVNLISLKEAPSISRGTDWILSEFTLTVPLIGIVESPKIGPAASGVPLGACDVVTMIG
jgi:hypothetical protein